jgi:hypothetical protein
MMKRKYLRRVRRKLLNLRRGKMKSMSCKIVKQNHHLKKTREF